MSRAPQETDVLVIGAGVSGLFQLWKLRQMGFSVRVLEAGGGVGGTWYWNRYPGARFDSESYSYSYSFDDELLRDWRWSEHFSAQPETLRYLNHVADRFDLRRDIRFDTRATSCKWDDERSRWTVEAEDGFVARCRYLITAIGALSAPVLPKIPGRDDFEGDAWHTAHWPHAPVPLEGRRVGVIGTGATGVQLIQEAAKSAGELYVFQRHPNWCAPLHNRPIDDDEWADIQARQGEILASCNASYGGFLHDAAELKTTEVTAEARETFWETLYASPGFGIWFGNYRDVLVDAEANRLLTEFIARKIRSRVVDPATAEKLIPRDHGFGTRRVPLESGYYEVFNQENVQLVDLLETPIERITPRGVRAGTRHYELDLLVYATGFDAVTGAFDRIEFTGVGGKSLRQAWPEGPITYLGMQTVGFPNLFTLVGPHNVSTFCNMPRCIEQNVEWVSRCLDWLRSRGHTRIEATADAAEGWTQHTRELEARLLMSDVDSWFIGRNANLPEKPRRTLLYTGGLPRYRDRSESVANDGYAGFDVR